MQCVMFLRTCNGLHNALTLLAESLCDEAANVTVRRRRNETIFFAAVDRKVRISNSAHPLTAQASVTLRVFLSRIGNQPRPAERIAQREALVKNFAALKPRAHKKTKSPARSRAFHENSK
jgi:hypothetical protein